MQSDQTSELRELLIIEYKRNKNDNVINQALSYLKWPKAQKLEFFQMLMQQKLGKVVADTITLDWKNPRVICIAESYSKFDIDTVEVVPLRIELYKFRFYENDVFSLEPVNIVEKNESAVVKTDAAKNEVDVASRHTALGTPLGQRGGTRAAELAVAPAVSRHQPGRAQHGSV